MRVVFKKSSKAPHFALLHAGYGIKNGDRMNDKQIDRDTRETKPLEESKIKSEWVAENIKSIEAYNRSVELHGVFSDVLRIF